MSAPDFLVHGKEDTVQWSWWRMPPKARLSPVYRWRMAVVSPSPPVTIFPLARSFGRYRRGDTLIKYGHDIGKAVAAIRGSHAHVQK